MKTENSMTGLVIVTHGQIGRAMLQVAEFILDQSLADIVFVSFRQSAADKTGNEEILSAIEATERGQGVLVLTDLGGASPCNQIIRLLSSSDATLVSGLNLAMLIRVWNYRNKPVKKLAQLAVEGAIRDIKVCDT
jgi:PTS system mannose-specific IIA component